MQFHFLSPSHTFPSLVDKAGTFLQEEHTQPHTVLRWQLAEMTECSLESMSLEPPQNKDQIITMIVYKDLYYGLHTEVHVPMYTETRFPIPTTHFVRWIW